MTRPSSSPGTPPEPPRESIYDARISPLMTQIIAVCKEAGIPMYASFALDGDLACTTYIVQPERIPEDEREDFEAWREKFGPLADKVRRPSPLMLTVRDRDGQITRMEAIV